MFHATTMTIRAIMCVIAGAHDAASTKGVVVVIQMKMKKVISLELTTEL